MMIEAVIDLAGLLGLPLGVCAQLKKVILSSPAQFRG